MEKTFEEIINEIKAGLTGDCKTDLKYLEEKCREYKDHEMAQEIVRICGQIMYEIIPEDVKAELSKAMEQDQSAERAVIDEIKSCVGNKEYDKALKMLEEYEEKISGIGFYENDNVSEYFQFDEFMQELIYRYRNQPTKEIREAKGIPYCEIYLLYGRVLTELKRFDEARKMLEKGLRWNPLSFDMTMAYIETYKLEGNLDKSFELIVGAFKIAIHTAQIGICYRMLGDIFAEKKLYPEAVACFITGEQFDRNAEQTQAEVSRIKELTGETHSPSMQDLGEYSMKYGFPIGADNEVVGMAFNYGKHFMETKEYGGAKYCLGIAYELTEDNSIKELLESIP